MMMLLLIGAVVLALMLRQRVVAILGFVAGFSYLVWGDGNLSYVILDIWAAADQEILLSIPLFILAGNIMSGGTIAERLIAVMRVMTAPIPGGLAIATILSCAVFAAISGSSTVTLIVAMGVFREDFWIIAKSVLPFLLLMFMVLLVVTFWPALSLYFVRM
ncbi:TRAP-type C4-dicarboxylate transport system, large permease component [hydrothermal vent metagenome]|uniref:TRAP-type C4-dicarboxylate transport system, large permease component n=1 Tax=hydrothermal vent metagenome TaxID=652676 RepID=A0A3B0RDM7_9ZZZZ